MKSIYLFADEWTSQGVYMRSRSELIRVCETGLMLWLRSDEEYLVTFLGGT